MKITRRQLRRLILQEVRIKPDVAGIPPQHLNKIHSLIDDGRLAQAQSLIDAFDGDPDYVDSYIEYGEVGDLEKMGNETADLFEPPVPNPGGAFPRRVRKSGVSADDTHYLDDKATALARAKRDKARDSYPPGFDAEDAYDMHIDRYFGNRNRLSPYRKDDFINEHRIKPSDANIPPQHLDKIHSLIDSGEIEQAQAFIDAFDGDPNYARNYKPYSSVGDLEKLGNNTAEMFQQHPENPGFKPGYTRQDAQANYDLATSISRKHADQFEDPDDGLDAFDTHFYDRYIPNVNKSAATGWDTDRFLK